MTQILHPLLFQVWPNHLPILSKKQKWRKIIKKDPIFQVHDFPKDSIPSSKQVSEKSLGGFMVCKEVLESVEVDAPEGTSLSTDLICLDNL